MKTKGKRKLVAIKIIIEAQKFLSSAKMKFLSKDIDGINLYCNSIHNSSEKLAFFYTKIFFELANVYCGGSLVLVKNVIINAIPVGIAADRYSILESVFVDAMRQFVSSGIPQYLNHFHADMISTKYQESEEKCPKVLTLDDLAFGFNLWLIACCVSICGFLCEIIKHYSFKIFQNYIGLLFILNSLSNVAFKDFLKN